MLTPNNGDPYSFALRLTDWDASQPNTETGVGTRSEIACRVVYHKPGLIEVEYLYTEFYERETPILPWRRTATITGAPNGYVEHVMRAALLTEFINLFPLEILWNGNALRKSNS